MSTTLPSERATDPIPGFEHLHYYFDIRHQRPAVKLFPGEFVVSRRGDLFLTLLGSCVSACVRDPGSGIGGMNHFLLPKAGASPGGSRTSDANRYGLYAMENLLNRLLRRGARRQDLEVKLFGGARILSEMSDVGRRNVDFVHRFLEAEGMQVAAEDVGGTTPRKVYYDSKSGRALVRRLAPIDLPELLDRERRYRQDLDTTPVAGSVELFDEDQP